MDYDGFRQMVLGANLKPMKGGQIPNMYDERPTEGCINPIATYDKIAHTNDNYLGYDEGVVRATLEMTEKDVLKYPENGGEFEKFFCKKCTNPMQRYTYMRLIDFDHYKTILVNEFDAEVFLILVNTFQK